METKRTLGYLCGSPRVSTRPEAGASGPRTHVLGVINAFQNLGWEVRSYIVGDKMPRAWVEGLESERTLLKSKLTRFVADWARITLGLMQGWNAMRVVGCVDWVYERCGSFQFLGYWFQRHKMPWILETNEVFYFSNLGSIRRTSVLLPLLRIWERWVYRKCDVLVCISQALADLIREYADVHASKIVVLPNGVDVRRLDPSQARPVRFFSDPTIGFVGHLYAWQRLDLILEAVARLRKEGIPYSIVVVGSGPMRETWEKLAVSLGISQWVRFTGYVPWEKIPDYIAGFDLGYAGAMSPAVTSMYLSPLKLYEYAAMGRPIVAANYADAQRLIEEGIFGYAFTPGDREHLYRVLRRAFEEREHWSEAEARNRSIVIEKHSWEVRIRELIKAAEQILEEKYGTPYPARC